ncbi:MAG: hypothetical protein KGM14_02595 [Actinomycetales bacterium]|nr:hypothetical protein [Actinomycetales bacterium]
MTMKRLPPLASAIYLVIMIAVVVTVDVLFFQNHTEMRLIGNVSVVALFLLGYVLLARAKK